MHDFFEKYCCEMEHSKGYQLVEIQSIKLFIPNHFVCSNANDMIKRAIDPTGHFAIQNLDTSNRLTFEQPFYWLLLGGTSAEDPHNFYAFVLIPTLQITNQTEFHQWKQSNAQIIQIIRKINTEVGLFFLNRPCSCKVLHQTIAKNFEQVFQIHSVLRHGSLIHMYQLLCKEWADNKSKQYGKNLERIFERVLLAWKMQQLLQTIAQVEKKYQNSNMEYWQQSSLSTQQDSKTESEMQAFLPLREAFSKCLAKCDRFSVLQNGNQIHKLPAEIRALLQRQQNNKADASIFNELQSNYAELQYTGVLHREVVPQLGSSVVIVVSVEYNHEKTHKSWRRNSQRNAKQMTHFYDFSLDITVQ